jgi:hypothetical protein
MASRAATTVIHYCAYVNSAEEGIENSNHGTAVAHPSHDAADEIDGIEA